jgi:hypothetical protein
MNRRSFLMSLTAGGLSMSVPAWAADSKRAIIELRQLKMRNTMDNMRQRTSDYLAKSLVPAVKRAGVQTVGAFTSVVSNDSPYVLLVMNHPNLAAWEATSEKLGADKDLQAAADAYYAGGVGYTRMEVTLLRGFPSMPNIEIPPVSEGKPSRVFELRTYESNNLRSLARKIRMFDEGEIDLFRKFGMAPVFFGETIAGHNMPNLVYMVGFDDLAARQKAWTAFATSPEWKKMSTQPGVSDAEIVSNISNSLVSPAPYSMIK